MTDKNTTPAEKKEPTTEADAVKTSPDKAGKADSKRDDQRGGRGGGRSQRGGRRGGRRNQQREPKEFEEAILQIDRVTRVVSGGRRLRFRISVVIGDKKGRVGFGIGKSAEVMVGIQKAVAQAKRNLINVPIFHGTIPHEMNSTFKSSRVLLFPAPEGKGVIAGGAVRRILELAGVRNVLSKVHGSRNKLNVAVATIRALQAMQNKAPYGTEPEPKEEESDSIDTPSSVKTSPDKTPDKEKTADERAPEKKATPKKKAPVKKSASKN